MDVDIVNINDRRIHADFKSESFSGYKCSNARKALRTALGNGEIEAACFWAAELICSLKIPELWDDIIAHYGSSINIGSAIMALYLCKRIKNFKSMAQEIESDMGFEEQLRCKAALRGDYSAPLYVPAPIACVHW